MQVFKICIYFYAGVQFLCLFSGLGSILEVFLRSGGALGIQSRPGDPKVPSKVDLGRVCPQKTSKFWRQFWLNLRVLGSLFADMFWDQFFHRFVDDFGAQCLPK